QKKLWVDKTARNVHRIRYILDHFPNAKVIHVIRDARDTIASLRTHRKRKVDGERLVLTGNMMPLQDCIDRWLLAIKDSIPFKEHPHYREIKYEDLIHNPTQTLESVCRFIGVTFEQEMLAYYEVDTPSRDPLNFPQNVEATRPISQHSIGRWKKDFNTNEIKEIMNQVGEEML